MLKDAAIFKENCKNRANIRHTVSRGVLSNFIDGEFVMVACTDFHKGEKLCLRWRGA